MAKRKTFTIFVLFLLVFSAGCSLAAETNPAPQLAVIMPSATDEPPTPEPSSTATATITPTSTITPTPTSTPVVFEVGKELTVDYLRSLEITGSQITFEEKLNDRSNYHQYLVSYLSEGNKIYGLLTVPFDDPPEGGYKAVIFNHGYIPPSVYQTRARYEAYVDYLARSGFVVFKIDYRGHGQSEGVATGSYFSPAYTIDSISALKSLQTLEMIDPDGIGMWGHSMAGNLVLRAMLIEPDIKAGVIWAGAVYSYDDFMTYSINDNTYRPPTPEPTGEAAEALSRRRAIFETYGPPDTQTPYWQAVSLTENIEYLTSPLQIHHAKNDTVVNIGYSIDLAAVLNDNGKTYEFFTYEGGGHNITSPYFVQAMQQTVEFFQTYLGE